VWERMRSATPAASTRYSARNASDGHASSDSAGQEDRKHRHSGHLVVHGAADRILELWRGERPGGAPSAGLACRREVDGGGVAPPPWAGHGSGPAASPAVGDRWSTGARCCGTRLSPPRNRALRVSVPAARLHNLLVPGHSVQVSRRREEKIAEAVDHSSRSPGTVRV
jgi:hypothetical protein